MTLQVDDHGLLAQDTAVALPASFRVLRRDPVAKTPGGVEYVLPRPLHLLPVTPSEHVLKIMAPHQPRLHHVQLSVDIVEASDDESISTRVVLFNFFKDGLGDALPGGGPLPKRRKPRSPRTPRILRGPAPRIRQ